MSRGREVMVGGVLVAGLAVAVAGTLWLQGRSLRDSSRDVVAVVQSAGQLGLGGQVKLLGVAIGRVSDIAVEPDGRSVRVHMRIDAAVALPDSAGLLLAPESMFGDWQAEIVDRTRHPRISFTDTGEEGVLPGYALPDLSRLAATADEISANLATITDRVQIAFTEETAENIAVTIQNVQRVSEQLQELIDQQGMAFDRVTTELADAAGEVGDAARAAQVSLDRIEGIFARGDVDSIVVATRDATSSLRDLSADLSMSAETFQETLASADSTFARLDRITARIEAGEGNLGRLVADSLLLSEAESALRELTELLIDFRNNPKRYVRLTIF